jgi:hypothetical protein
MNLGEVPGVLPKGAATPHEHSHAALPHSFCHVFKSVREIGLSVPISKHSPTGPRQLLR